MSNKKICKNIDEAEELVQKLMTAGNTVSAIPTAERDGIEIQWLEFRNYTALDGKEYPDEVWTTKDGEMIHVQDMSEAHVRNTLRMLIRNRRLKSEALQQAYSNLDKALADSESATNDPLSIFDAADDNDTFFTSEIPPNRTIH